MILASVSLFRSVDETTYLSHSCFALLVTDLTPGFVVYLCVKLGGDEPNSDQSLGLSLVGCNML